MDDDSKTFAMYHVEDCKHTVMANLPVCLSIWSVCVCVGKVTVAGPVCVCSAVVDEVDGPDA